MRKMQMGIAILAVVASIATAVGASAQGQTTLIARMNGAKEVSSEGEKGVGDPDGRGFAKIRLDRSASQVCFRLSWSNIGSPSAAHIHDGGPDEAGPVVVTLFSGESPLPATISGVKGCSGDVGQDVITAIKNDPAGHYVNVHNAEYPGGAIRGQLRKP
jgi:hypothetical protein